MTKLLSVIASSAALVSCSTVSTTVHRAVGMKSEPNPKIVQVYVVQGTAKARIVISQEPLVFVGDQGVVQIQWLLQDPDYQFDDNRRIRITTVPGTKAAVSNCNAQGKGNNDFSCDDDTRIKGSSKYTITVKPKPGSNLRTPDAYDPMIIND
jgi:hypothetical protein